MNSFKSFKTLYHLGSMNPANKGIQGSSLEGKGLSVSECPDAWRQIARLGGLPCWTLRRPGNQFLDYHKLSAPQWASVTAWGEAQGLVVPATLWVLTYEDDELGGEVEQVFASLEAANAEVESEDEGLTSRPGFLGTESLSARMGRDVPPSLTLDFLALAYAEDQLDIDGVYWADKLDPGAYSAPRAVIFPCKLQSWSISPA